MLATIVIVIIIIHKCYETHHFGREYTTMVKNMSQVWSVDVVI